MNAQLDSGAVVASISIDGLLNQRESVINQLRQAISILHDCNQFTIDNAMFVGSEYRKFQWIVDGESRYHNTLLNHECLPAIIQRMDSALWGKLMHESGLMSFMDSKARQEFSAQVQKCETPALTHENIAATFKALHAGRDDMFDRGVINCFKKLSWCYKTNNPVMFGKRIIKGYIRSYGSWRSESLSDLDDLQRVFRVIDGKPEEDHRSGLSARLYGVSDRNHAQGLHRDDYMDIKWFKNGNGHITFKRPELVDRMNSIIAKHFPGALPPASEARS